jgi:signal peptidase
MSRNRMGKVMKLIKKVTIVVLVVVCLMSVVPMICYMLPFLAGADSSFTVMSGSMAPTLKSGDLILNKKVDSSSIDVGDILTVRSGERTFTHRVVEKQEGPLFRLKGDANEDPDLTLVEPSHILGKVVLVFPFSYLYTPYGFVFMLLAPASLIIGIQMYRVYQFTRKRNKKETMRWRRNKASMLGTSTLLLALILTVSTTRIVAPHFIVGSSSYFSDTEWATGFFYAGIWEIGANIDIKPDVLNLGSQGQWIMVYATIETDYDEDNIDVSTVILDDAVYAEWGEVQDDGRFMVKFDRAEVIAYLIGKGCKDGDDVTLTVSGEFTDEVRFTGEDTIEVIS